MKIKTNGLVGRWQTQNEDSSVILEISKNAKGFKVRAFDKDDKEEFVISKTKWDGESLSFETYVPSTKYRTRNSLKLTSRTRLIQELTFWEHWKKCKIQGRVKLQ